MKKINYTLLLIFCMLSGAFAQFTKDTTIINIRQINTSEDEYLPFLVDSTLFFTSTRKNTREGQTLEFSEKVYYMLKKGGNLSSAKKMGYKWNSDNNTALVGISPDYYFFYRAYWRNNGDIFAAKRVLDDTMALKAFKLKKLTKICSEFDENSATAGFGDTIIFVSNRNGNYDIFMQIADNIPVSIDSLNSEYDEEDVFLTPDSKTLYFSSNRPGGKGGFDIYKSMRINNNFTKPVLVQLKGVNTEADDRDFRWYNDSTMFLSSNRGGGQGGFDIYMISISSKKITKPVKDSIAVTDTVKKIQTITKSDTNNKVPVATEGKNLFVVSKDTIQQEREDLIAQLKMLGLTSFRGEVQLGAYRFIQSLDLFKQKFPCINNEDIRMDKQIVDSVIIYKFIINKLFTDINLALDMQLRIINYHCLPEQNVSDMPFIALIDENNNRFAIFWKKDEFLNKKIFYIYENGKQIWKSKRF